MVVNQAVGVIETCGMPAAIVTADLLGKSGDVTVMGLENSDAGRISVIIRGATGAVQAAIASTVNALKKHPGVTILGYHVVPCPDESAAAIRVMLGRRQIFEKDAVEWLDD